MFSVCRVSVYEISEPIFQGGFSPELCSGETIVATIYSVGVSTGPSTRPSVRLPVRAHLVLKSTICLVTVRATIISDQIWYGVGGMSSRFIWIDSQHQIAYIPQLIRIIGILCIFSLLSLWTVTYISWTVRVLMMTFGSLVCIARGPCMGSRND